MRALSSSMADEGTAFVTLPPVGAVPSKRFSDVEADDGRYGELLALMQRFRGRIYLSEGAILPSQLTGDGRHVLPTDAHSWHVLSVDANGQVCACLRFHEEGPEKGYQELGVWKSAIAQCSTWGQTVRNAVDMERFSAQHQQLRFGEVGGWAIAPERRNRLDAVKSILATYGLLEVLGGAVGLATATRKHSSASILRRLGLQPLRLGEAEIPSYYDPYYSSEMELLRFDSRSPAPKYANWVAELGALLACAPVICAGRPAAYPTKAPDRAAVKCWWPIPVENFGVPAEIH